MKAQVTEATARQIEQHLYSKGLSPARFAASCNVSDQTIYRLTAKHGRQKTARLDTAKAIADGMGLAVPELFGGIR